ncbi:PREDICTED: uncharacterized protein LOC104765637 [Camelina sativa]|uniref:Uncharacterized protein LOC104765637 n=1 Tax=Camelina sativa TaxID=90675 RepID=A0ABM0XLF8_CAMSA|nr:PREDICTED: uncharacterized protein LOC104765637 [Camelina sativa]
MRRLPPWMLGGASTGEATDPRNVSEPEEAPKPKAEKRPRRNVKPKEKDFKLNADEPKRARRKMGDEAKRSNNDGPEMVQPVMTDPENEDLTVDDLLSFAHEYVQSDEVVHTSKEEDQGLSSMSESNITTSSQGGTKDSTAQDMLELLMGPFFKKH